MCYLSERKGDDPLGRTYTSTFSLTDNSGNVGSALHTVFVPHDADAFDVSVCDKGTVNSKGKRMLRA
jgi:hypothetical protein